MAASGPFQRRDQNNGWSGNFAPGDALLFTNAFTQDINQITLTGFDGPGIVSGGAQIQANFYGNFVARIEAFDATNVSLGFFDVNGLSSGAGNNSAPFIGVTSDTPITSLSLSVLSARAYKSSFAINRFDFSPVPGPLPILGAGAAFGFSRKLRSRIKAARLNGNLPDSCQWGQRC